MMSGLMARSASYPSPQLSSTPGEKPSATTSDMATRRRAISRPFGCLTFSETPRLPGFLLLNCPPMSGSVTPGSGPIARSRAARPPTGAIAAMRVSGWLFSSTLMLSAPNALRRRAPADGPGRARRQPLARRVAERPAELRVLHVRTAPAREPVRVHRVLVRLPQGRPEHAGLLGLAPRHVLVGERAHE